MPAAPVPGRAGPSVRWQPLTPPEMPQPTQARHTGRRHVLAGGTLQGMAPLGMRFSRTAAAPPARP